MEKADKDLPKSDAMRNRAGIDKFLLPIKVNFKHTLAFRKNNLSDGALGTKTLSTSTFVKCNLKFQDSRAIIPQVASEFAAWHVSNSYKIMLLIEMHHAQNLDNRNNIMLLFFPPNPNLFFTAS